MDAYLTRNLVARGTFRHEGRELKAGDPFTASEPDSRYYLQTGQAADAQPPTPPAEPPAAPPAEPPAAPPADDAHVAVGAERFSDGQPQTDESLAAAREGTDQPSIAPGIDGLRDDAAEAHAAPAEAPAAAPGQSPTAVSPVGVADTGEPAEVLGDAQASNSGPYPRRGRRTSAPRAPE